jgi:hypothetical protein
VTTDLDPAIRDALIEMALKIEQEKYDRETRIESSNVPHRLFCADGKEMEHRVNTATVTLFQDKRVITRIDTAHVTHNGALHFWVTLWHCDLAAMKGDTE